MVEENSAFQLADYIVLGFMFVVSFVIGLYYAVTGRKNKSVKEYFNAGGNVGIVPAALSLLASVLCSIWYVGLPVEVYTYGFYFAMDLPCVVIALLISGYAFLPVFYELNLTSVAQYLEMRFNVYIRRIGSFLYLMTTALYVALVMYIPALAISSVININIWVSVSLMCIVATAYTALGGIRAVMWTDVFQSVIIYTSLVAIVIKGTIDVGGINVVWERGIQGDRVALIPFSLDPRYRYNFFWFFMTELNFYLSFYAVYQTQVQRYVSCPSIKDAQRALFVNIPGLMFIVILVVYIGLILYANFYDCDPLSAGMISEESEILIYYVTKLFKEMPGMSGFFVSGIFSGALSTVSSCLNSMAAVTLEDFVILIPRFKQIKDETKTYISKWIATAYGLIMMILLLILERVDSLIAFWAYNNGVVFGINLSLYTLGLFCPWVHTIGILSAFSVSALLSLFISIGSQIEVTTFEPAPTSIANCDWANSNITVHSHNISRSAQTPILYANDLENNGGIYELFKISPLFIQPLTFFISVTVGMVCGGIFDRKGVTPENVKLFSPVIRNWVRRHWLTAEANDAESEIQNKGKEIEEETLIIGEDRKNIAVNGISYLPNGALI